MSEQATNPYQKVSSVALIDQAIAEMQSDVDDEKAWAIIYELKSRNIEEIFNLATKLCAQPTVAEKILGIRLLNMGFFEEKSNGLDEQYIRPKTQQAKPILKKRLLDKNAKVLASAIFVTGHLSLADELINQRTDLATHKNADVRGAMASCLDVHVENSNAPIEMLVKLMKDQDANVRDWAVFNLGCTSDIASPHINDALASCLNDQDHCVRIQAVASLFQRGDDRFLQTLEDYDLEDFCATEYSDILWLETVGGLASPAFLPKLQWLKKQAAKQNDDFNVELIQVAINKCQSVR